MKSLSILILDDEQRVLDEIEEFLKSKNFQVFTAVEVSTAEKILEKERIDIVILDVKLPGISGLDGLARVSDDAREDVLAASRKIHNALEKAG